MKWLQQWWLNNHPVTQLEVKQAIHPIEQATADIETMMADNIEKSSISRHDLYRAAVIAGLLARAGVMGGPEHNPNFIEWADTWAEELLK